MARLGEILKEEMSGLLAKYGFAEPRTSSGNLYQAAWTSNGRIGLEVIFDELEQDFVVSVGLSAAEVPLRYSEGFKGYTSPEEARADERAGLGLGHILAVRAPAESERLRRRMGRKVVEGTLTKAEQREIVREIGRLLDTYASDILAGDQSAIETVRRQAERG